MHRVGAASPTTMARRARSSATVSYKDFPWICKLFRVRSCSWSRCHATFVPPNLFWHSTGRLPAVRSVVYCSIVLIRVSTFSFGCRLIAWRIQRTRFKDFIAPTQVSRPYICTDWVFFEHDTEGIFGMSIKTNNCRVIKVFLILCLTPSSCFPTPTLAKHT